MLSVKDSFCGVPEAPRDGHTSPAMKTADPMQEATRRWITRVLEATGYSATKLAQECGLCRS
jgi:hypothetical protein